MSGASSIYQALLHNSVKMMTVYTGGAIMPLVNEFNKHVNYIPFYVNNHEQNGGHTATGYAKATGGNETGVAIVTSGPGLTNLITPMLDATNDSTPLVVLSGQVPISAMGTNAFQECPATQITKPVTKWSYCAQKNDNLFELINEAFKIANSGKKGTVHIDLPKCVLNDKNGSNNKFHDIIINKINKINEEYEPKIYRNLHNIIMKSKKPILYVGKGTNNYADLLDKLANYYDIPVTTTIHANGTFNENNERLSLGFLGMHGIPAANFAIQESDLIIALGSRFDDRTTGNIKKYAPKCKDIIHVNIEQNEFNKVVRTSESRNVININQDTGNFINNLLSYAEYNKFYKIKSNHEWISHLTNLKQQYAVKYNKPINDKLNTQMVLESLNKFNHDNTIFTTGVGNHQMMASQFLTFTQPNQFITSGSLGVMGTGLPYAIGAQIAYPNKTVIDIDGDASFNHTLGDLQTIKRYNLPIKIIIMNDGKMSMVKAWEQLFFENNYVATDSVNPDYELLAKSYGIKSVTVTNKLSLDDALNDMMTYKGAFLLNAIVESDLCLPLVAPGKGLDEMILLNNSDNDLNLSKSGYAPN